LQDQTHQDDMMARFDEIAIAVGANKAVTPADKAAQFVLNIAKTI
jgi:hypothetical protein